MVRVPPLVALKVPAEAARFEALKETLPAEAASVPLLLN